MKKWNLFPLLILPCIAILSCGGNTTLDITITSQPEGGENITEISCTFEGMLVNGTTPIEVTIEWWGQYSGTAYEEIQKRESHTFSSETAEAVTTSITTPTGYVWTGYFYVKLIWEDEDGSDHEIESSQAYCYLGSGPE